ncbi:unnamed protein product [Coccothraustes coccothraustes]
MVGTQPGRAAGPAEPPPGLSGGQDKPQHRSSAQNPRQRRDRLRRSRGGDQNHEQRRSGMAGSADKRQACLEEKGEEGTARKTSSLHQRSTKEDEEPSSV